VTIPACLTLASSLSAELGYPDAVMEKIFHANAERILGL